MSWFCVDFVLMFLIAYWFFSADSKDDADKWLCGLNILYQEVMSAPTPAITERYVDIFSLCEACCFFGIESGKSERDF